MKKIVLSIAVILTNFAFCFSQNWNWVNSGGNTGSDIAKHVSLDSSGNSYVVGIFRQSIFTGINQLNSLGGDDFFIAKYDPIGNLLWAKSGGGVSDDGYSMMSATDPVGNTVVALASIDNVQFGTFNLTNILNDVTLLKYDKDGNILFARSYGSNSNDVATSIALDPLGNFYVAGFFANTINFNTISLNSYGITDTYLAKFDSNGLPLWAVHGGGNSYDAASGIAVDKFNHVYLTGYYSTNSNFGGMNLSSSGGDDVFLVCYDTNGSALWAKSGNGTGTYDIGNKIGCDRDGNVYTIGQFENTISFDGFTANSLGQVDVFIVKADSSGNFKWIRSYGGSGDDVGFDIDVMENGSMFFTGYFNDVATFGSSNLVSNGGMDMFTARNFNDGSTFWVKQNGGTGDDIARSIKARNETECYIVGNFSDQVTFDNISLQSNGILDFFAGKMFAPLSAVNEIYSNESFSVFPNPISVGQELKFEFQTDHSDLLSLELINSIGSIVSVVTFTGEKNISGFVVPDLSDGIYFLRLNKVNGKSMISKISIQN